MDTGGEEADPQREPEQRHADDEDRDAEPLDGVVSPSLGASRALPRLTPRPRSRLYSWAIGSAAVADIAKVTNEIKPPIAE